MSRAHRLPTRARRRLTDWLYALGYACLVVCYTPQWARMLRDPSTAAGIAPGLFVLATAGLILMQWALLRDRFAARALRLGNALALANAVAADVVYLWALAQV